MSEIMRDLAQYQHDDDARRRVAIAYSLQDNARLKRIRSALGKRVLPIRMGDRVVEYYPSTGKFVWGAHPAPNRVGMDALYQRADGTRYIYTDQRKNVTAARLAHEAIHGPLPEDHEVYCINNDPGDLRAINLRCKAISRPYKLEKVTMRDEDREKIREMLRKKREEREARGKD